MSNEQKADEQESEALDVFNAFAGSRHRANEAVMGWRPGREPMLPPWSPVERIKARHDLTYSADHALTTILREERITRKIFIEHYCRKCRGLGTKRHHAKCPRRGCKTVKAPYVMYPGQDGMCVSEVMPDGHTERVL